MKAQYMIFFIYGKDTFRSREYIHKMVEKFRLYRDPQGLNVSFVDCETQTAPAVAESLLTMPFLAERRMIILRHSLSSKQANLQETLRALVEEKKIPSSNVAVFWDTLDAWKTNAAKALAERLLQEEFVQKFDLLSGNQLVEWIAKRGEQRGTTIEKQAALFLAAHVGNDIWYLAGLIDQLAAYASSSKDQSVHLSDVRLFVDEKSDDNIFNFVDALVAKRGASVFAMMREQYRERHDPGYLFAMVVRQFRILLEMRDLFDHEDSLQSETMAKKLELHPFVVKKSLPFVKRYSLAEFKAVYDESLMIDIQTKTGQGDQSLLLDIFVGKQ